MHRTIRPYELLEPRTLIEATNLLNKYKDKAKILAGGLDVVSRMRRWQINPEYIVSIREIPDLKYIKHNGANGLEIGPMITLRDVELSNEIRKHWSLLYEAASLINSVQVRTMGTVIGNLCVASPASDIAPVLYVLGAKLQINGNSSGHSKEVSIEDFFIPVCSNILNSDQIVTSLSVPVLPPNTGTAFLKLSHTRACIAKVNIAVMVTVEGNICKDLKIALGAIAPTVIRAKKSEKALKNQVISEDRINEASILASEGALPITDLRSTADYRQEMVAILTKRAILRAVEEVKGKGKGDEKRGR